MEDKDSKTIDSSELPFLVTHWLSNFQALSSNSNDAAVQRIHQAASDMASAFAELGVFGSANQPQLKRLRQTYSSSLNNNNKTNHATYKDVQRQWSHVPPHQLELVAASAASVARVSGETAVSNLFHVARELRPDDATGGRRLGDTTVDLTRDDVNDSSDTKVRSILHALPLFGPSTINREQANSIVPYVGPQESQAPKTLPVSVVSDFDSIARRTSDVMRAFLSTRDSHRVAEEEAAVLKRAINNQEGIKRLALTERDAAAGNLVRAEQMWQESQNADRVMAQLGNKLAQVIVNRNEFREKLTETELEARSTFQQCKHLAVRFRDPLQQDKFKSVTSSMSMTGTMLDISSGRKNRITSFLAARQCGMNRVTHRGWKIGRPIGMTDAKEMRKAVTATRLSHALTINTHLHFPIYCLSFDKSGRYFCTGADDCLVKVFFLGAGQSPIAQRSYTYGANDRGAIQVCTLRGHAGVICDIDVSSDNAFLATASDDGDVRVWGLKDGCPVAILRGHGGGANMVSWSKLTPYRLVTSGMDGLAQIWDIRQAALKRYGTHIGHRPEYTLALTESEKQTISHTIDQVVAPSAEVDDDGNVQVVLLPPLPARDGESDTAGANAPPANPAANLALPPGDPVNAANNNPDSNVNPAGADNDDDDNISPGAFVSNATMDEGVRIVAKLQHGEVVQENNGPGTRARRKKVNVICIARCPVGGHFATGSDDGLCRVWEDEDDDRVAMIDNRGRVTKDRIGSARVASTNGNVVPSTRRLLTALVGHMGAITDLHYSHAGDRILTASQKDGNARIWSFGQGPQCGSSRGSLRNRFLDAKQIVLRLSKMMNSSVGRTPRARSGRRRGTTSTSSATSSVTCDVAVWTADDSKIVTSQSCPVKANSQEIVPGSQLLLVWDSWTGNCLLAIKQAHLKQCPVIATHPLEPSIICSAGADGVAKVWDLETGKCLFLHRNTIESDPVAQNNEKNKESGYLDGMFDPHGQLLLLTDDNGRISVFDCLRGYNDGKRESSPSWMKEQYFANDYYELFYNSNGYCVERGSEQPPHLAPRSARCNYSGAAWADDVSETYRLMKGPSPISEAMAMSERSVLRSRTRMHLPSGDNERRATIMTDFDPDRTVQINGSAEMIDDSPKVDGRALRASTLHVVEHETEASTRRRTTTTAGRSLSNNYRWRDYDDLIREEGMNEAGDPDFADEEEFVPAARHEEEEDLSDAALSDSEFQSGDEHRERNGRSSARSRETSNARSQRVNRRNRDRDDVTNTRSRDRMDAVNQELQPTRTSSRRVGSTTNDNESEEEDDGIVEECLSTNNAPSGPFAHDYTVDGHLFKLSNLTTRVNREWLSRAESVLSYSGMKGYAPQVGDSVVYIPKAHAETIREFPTLKAPWKNWPSGSRWPIVRCRIVNVRYRFPYKDYFSRRSVTRCASVVAILTLEVTGIPEVSADREYPWPKPAFIDRQSRSAAQMFEVSIFECDICPEFIFPEALFIWRLTCLEHALRQQANNAEGLKVVAYYIQEGSGEDAANDGYDAEVIEYCGSDEVGDEHLNKSGFESLRITWLDDPDAPSEAISPWEASIHDKAFDTPRPPSLTSEEKRAVSNLLRRIEGTEHFREFNRSVDVARYPDYLARIEIPMDISRIKQRLREDYYSSTLSVLADVRLIRENCIKYNGTNADIAILAFELYTASKDGLKSELSDAGVDADNIARLDEDPEIVLQPNLPTTPRENQGPRTRSAAIGDTRSSLELLPPPMDQPSSRPTRGAPIFSGRGRSILEQPSTPVLGRATSIQEEDIGIGRVAPRSTRSNIRNSNQSTSSRRSARPNATLSALAQDEYHEEEEKSVEGSGNGSRASRPSRSQRASKRSRYSYSEEDHNTEEESEEDKFDEVEDDEEELVDDSDDAKEDAEKRTTRASRKPPQDKSAQPAGGRRAAQLASNNEIPRRHSSRIRQPKKYEEYHLSDTGVAAIEDEKSSSKGRRPRRESTGENESLTRQSRRPATYKEMDSDDDLEEEGKPASRSRDGARSSLRSLKVKAESAHDRGSPSRSRRASNRASAIYNEVESDDDPEEEEEIPVTPVKISTRGRRGSSRMKIESISQQDSPSRQSPRSRPSTKYTEKESDYDEESDEDEEGGEEDSEEESSGDSEASEEPASARVKRGRSSRRAAPEPAKKRSRISTGAQSSSLPVTAKWPSISVKFISRITIGVLETLRSHDRLELFSIPVAESYPEIEKAYLQKIKIPMDFRTIEEDRLHVYEEISELQDDLIQVFRNCVEYNSPQDQYGRFAIKLWEQLDDVFQKVCIEEGVKTRKSR